MNFFAPSTCFCSKIINEENIIHGQLYWMYEPRNDAIRWNDEVGEWTTIKSINPCAKLNTQILTIY